MNYEKRYKEALSKAKDMLSYKEVRQENMEYLFPELKNNDERIRKTLIDFFSKSAENGEQTNGIYDKDIITWLNKQDNKPVNIDIESMVSSYKQRLESPGNGSMKNNPLINMCLTAFKHGVEEVLQELNLKEFEKPQGESESERIRKAVKAIKEEKVDNENKVEQKFHEGDWIIFNEHHNSVYQVEKIQGLQYYLRHYNGGSMSVYIDSQLIRQWTFADAKDGDVLYSLDSKQPFIFKHRKKHEQAEVYCGINIYGKFFVGNTKDCIITTDKYIPATKEQRDLLFQKMKVAGYVWDAEKKGFIMKIEPKFKVGEWA